MTMLFQRFRNTVISCCRKIKPEKLKTEHIDDKIALGVLLWGVGAVAEADRKFLPEEDKEIEEILFSHAKISKRDVPIVLTAIRQAAIGNINLYRIAREFSKKLPYNIKVLIIESLFRVAYSDRELDKKEYKVIKKIADIFHIDKKDLTDIDIKFKAR